MGRGYNRAPQVTHRLAWEFANGPIPVGLLVCHKCDNRRCVNPNHLFLGTHRDNTRDMMRKGRMARNAPPAKVVGERAAELVAARKSGTPWRDIAQRFGVSRGTAMRTFRRASHGHGASTS